MTAPDMSQTAMAALTGGAGVDGGGLKLEFTRKGADPGGGLRINQVDIGSKP